MRARLIRRTAVTTRAARIPPTAPTIAAGMPASKIAAQAVGRVQEQASAPEAFATAVERALTVTRPRARYLVGTDAYSQIAMRRALPTRATDAAVAWFTGTPSQP